MPNPLADDINLMRYALDRCKCFKAWGDHTHTGTTDCPIWDIHIQIAHEHMRRGGVDDWYNKVKLKREWEWA